MTLHSLEGHEDLKASLSRAHVASELPSVLLLHGPRGVGKQRLALWIGQLLVCVEPSRSGPCGRCRGCQLSLELGHPDLLWYFPIKRPPSKGSRERDQEALEESRAERLAQFREQSLQPSYTEDALGIHLGTVRNLRREASRTAALAHRRVFVVGEAQELVSQEASPEAANALLKVLEEPAPDQSFLLTSSEPGRLLPTVRSRTTAVYTPQLPTAQVRDFLSRQVDASSDEIERATALSGGSIGRALGFLPEDSEPGPLERIRQDAFHLVRAALASAPTERFVQSLAFPPAGARGLHELLSSVETWLRDLATVASSSEAPLLNADARNWLFKQVSDDQIDPVRVVRCAVIVERARQLASGNVNPQLIVNQMLSDLSRELRGPLAMLEREAS